MAEYKPEEWHDIEDNYGIPNFSSKLRARKMYDTLSEISNKNRY